MVSSLLLYAARLPRRKAHVQCRWNMSYVPFQGKPELLFYIVLPSTASFISVLLPRSSSSSLSLSLRVSLSPPLSLSLSSPSVYLALSYTKGMSKRTIADRSIEITRSAPTLMSAQARISARRAPAQRVSVQTCACGNY